MGLGGVGPIRLDSVVSPGRETLWWTRLHSVVFSGVNNTDRISALEPPRGWFLNGHRSKLMPTLIRCYGVFNFYFPSAVTLCDSLHLECIGTCSSASVFGINAVLVFIEFTNSLESSNSPSPSTPSSRPVPPTP